MNNGAELDESVIMSNQQTLDEDKEEDIELA